MQLQRARADGETPGHSSQVFSTSLRLDRTPTVSGVAEAAGADVGVT